MRKIIVPVLACALSAAIAASQTVAPPWIASDAQFSAFMERFKAGMDGFLNGDPTLWKKNASQTERATIMGAWGAYERTWKEAGPRYDWAAARFQQSGAKADIEYLSGGISGELAYTVAIERSRVHIVGQKEPAVMQLRVTHVYGSRESGEWKLLHRHADPLIEKTAPGDVLAQSP